MFAARKEFELLKLLATDKKALATARRLGAFRPQLQPPSPAVAAGDGKAAAAPPPVAAAPAASAPAQNSRQRRGALRSAKYHATRRAQFWSRSVLATMFIVKLSHEPADADVDDVGGALRHAVPVDEETLHCIVDSTVASLLRLPCPAFLNLGGLVASAETLLTNWSTTVDLMPQSAEAKAVAQASVAAAAEGWASRDGVLKVLVHTMLMLDHAEFDPMPHRLKGDALR